ncbi:protein FAM180A [Erpetoichthys calabaricus]|uniref:protein FAM180A n=1 Tax=Erpetoichthys calabaricus TaxID=27687 RepID=UPI00109F691C|nr:protein FAM180A [Erpetoichthys calabaricus]
MHWIIFFISLFYYNVGICADSEKNKALFPRAARVKRGSVVLFNPYFQTSFKEVYLLYEILLSGLEIKNNKLSVKDEELASLKKTEKLKAIFEEVLPRNLQDVQQLTSGLSYLNGTLNKDDFERLILTLVYTVYQVVHVKDHWKDAWAEAFVELYNAIKQDIML